MASVVDKLAMGDVERVVAEMVGDVEDVDLDELDDLARQEAALLAPMGASHDDADDEDPEAPYDLELVKPRAVDLLKLCAVSGTAVPPTIAAALGPNVPILLHHGLTPFAPAGTRPVGVWGMGYEVTLDGVDARTVSVLPATTIEEVGSVDSKVDFGLDVGGGISLLPAPLALAVATLVPGLSLPSVEMHAVAHQRFSFALRMSLSFLRVQAGPVGAGGARWNVYRGAESIDSFLPLVQTILVPSGLDRLEMTVGTWVRRRGRWGGLRRARAWKAPPQAFEVSLAGVDTPGTAGL